MLVFKLLMDLERFIEEWRRGDEEAKEIRKREADWNFIEKQKEPIKTALKLLIETRDLRLTSRITGIGIDKLNNIRIKAKVPLIL